MMYCKRKTVL